MEAVNSLNLYQYSQNTFWINNLFTCSDALFPYLLLFQLFPNAGFVKSLIFSNRQVLSLSDFLRCRSHGYKGTFPLYGKNHSKLQIFVTLSRSVFTFPHLSTWQLSFVCCNLACSLDPASSTSIHLGCCYMTGWTQARTFHLHEVELVNGLQQRAVVQTQVEVCGHPGSECAFSPLILSQVHSPYEGVRDLIISKTTA